jgi:formate dehydrogenase (coenzyme F420) beta subunit
MVNIAKLHEEIKKILTNHEVKYVIGYQKNSYGFQITPLFISVQQDIKKTLFSPFCLNNLATYIKYEEGTKKIGIVVKGCDSRSLIEMIKEKRIPRERLVIIGIPCTGVIDPKKLQEKFPEMTEDTSVSEKNEDFIFTRNGKSRTIPKDELLLEKCLSCEYPNPLIFDVLISNEVQTRRKENYHHVKEFEQKPLEEKWRFWEEQFERCIRCYACRNICPLCYCEECRGEQLDPQWLRRSVNLSENTVWNMMRAFHLAGRCTGCGECERACPMEIPLMLLNKKLEKDIKELYNYTSGINVDDKSVFATFKPDDPEEWVI